MKHEQAIFHEGGMIDRIISDHKILKNLSEGHGCRLGDGGRKIEITWTETQDMDSSAIQALFNSTMNSVISLVSSRF